MSRTMLQTCLSVWVAGCAASAPAAPQHANPSNGMACRFVGIEAVQGSNDSDIDAISLLAVYRFSDAATSSTRRPLALKFVVERSRVDELREHLAARPEVICTPDATANYSAHVEPFEGIPGIPQR